MTAALWCVLAAIMLPYVCFGIARNRGRGSQGQRLRDNRNPRDFPNRIQGLAKRAWDAQLNSFESLPGFAAAVIIAHLVHAPQNQIDALAVGLGVGPSRLRGVLPRRQEHIALLGPVRQSWLRAGAIRHRWLELVLH